MISLRQRLYHDMGEQESKARPNYVLFMPDQLRYDCIGAFGNNCIKTPNIDQLAASGTKFTNNFLQHSVCSQSRCSIFTSKYPHVTGKRGLNSLLQPFEDNLFKTLKENGYHVAILGPRGDLFAEGATEISVDEYGFIVEPEVQFTAGKEEPTELKKVFDLWGRLFYKGKREAVVDYDEALIKSAELWLKNAPNDKPWILLLPLIFPHCPFNVEEPYFSMYERENLPKPSDPKERIGYEPKYFQALRKSYDIEDVTLELWKEVIGVYYGMISRIDAQLGRIASLVDKETTYMIFFTDHGEYLGDHGLIEKWPSGVSDSLVHEPLIISGPGISKGKTIDALTEMVDLGATILDLSSVGIDYAINGKSLLPLLRGDKDKIRDYVISEGGFLITEEPIIEYATFFPYNLKAKLQHKSTEIVGRVIALRDQNYTFIYRLYEKNELYSRNADPKELHNLIDDPEYGTLIARYEKILLNFFLECSDHAPLSKDERFPKVLLASPREQYEERLAKQENNEKW